VTLKLRSNIEQAVAYEASHISVTGNGESLEVALVSCLAEATDFVSQIERPGDLHGTGSPETFLVSVANGWTADVVSGASRIHRLG
jgi:hypothetical protein